MIFRTMLAIQLVVGTHDGPGLSFFDRGFKRWQIDFAQGSFIHDDIDIEAAGLLVIRGKMLQGGAHPLALHSGNNAGGHLACQIRVFRKILEVAAA